MTSLLTVKIKTSIFDDFDKFFSLDAGKITHANILKGLTIV
jgi:hypothetical protein